MPADFAAVADADQRLQHGRMHRFVKIGNMFIAPIDCQAVLNQVVGPDREKINLFRQQVGDQYGSGGLDHDADFNLIAEAECLLTRSS